MKNTQPIDSPANDIESRIDVTESLLSSGMRKSEIKAELQKRYGIKYRSCETLIARARTRILASTKKPREEHRAEAFAFYQSVIANDAATIRDKLRAQQQICFLLGLNAPAKVAVTDTDGKDMDIDDARALIAELAERVLLRLSAEESGNEFALSDDVLGQTVNS